ncbi:hypothetical protein COOONC_28182 [Cooperia oncophora]
MIEVDPAYGSGASLSSLSRGAFIKHFQVAKLNLSGSATPPSPPAVSVSARASASTDGGMPTSPLFSPSRANVRPHLSRMYRPGMRSLDSGLDLSSPTIGHHALFIKEFLSGRSLSAAQDNAPTCQVTAQEPQLEAGNSIE